MMMTVETDPGWPTTMPLTVRHSQVVTSHDTKHSLHESVTCHKTVQTSSSYRCGYVVRWPNHRCVTWSASRELGDTSLGSREQSAGSAGSRVASWKRIQTLTGRQENWQVPRRQAKSEVFRWQQSGDLKAYSDTDWGGDRATRRSVSAGVILRGSHCLKAWTKK